MELKNKNLHFVPSCLRGSKPRSPIGAPRRSSTVPHRLRGVAEIELLLSVMVLVTLMLLVAGAVNIGRARMDKTNEAAYEAWYDNTVRPTPLLEGDSAFSPIAGLDAVRPGWPNRTHVSRPRTSLSIIAGPGETLAPVTITASAATIGPAWSYGAYPNADDRATAGVWFQNYADESHTVVTDPLGLAPAYPP